MSIREEVLSRAIRKLTASGECVTPAHTCLQRGLDRRDPERMCNFCYGMFAMAWQPERPEAEVRPARQPERPEAEAHPARQSGPQDSASQGGSTKALENPR